MRRRGVKFAAHPKTVVRTQRMSSDNDSLLIRRRVHYSWWIFLLVVSPVFGGGAWFLISVFFTSHLALSVVLPSITIALLLVYVASLSKTVTVARDPSGSRRLIVTRRSVFGSKEEAYEGVSSAEAFHLGLLDNGDGPGVALVTTSTNGVRRRALSTWGGREDCGFTVEDIRKVATAINGKETPVIDAKSHDELRLSQPQRPAESSGDGDTGGGR